MECCRAADAIVFTESDEAGPGHGAFVERDDEARSKPEV